MKQNITLNQMGDLSLKGMGAFKNWYTEKGYHLNNHNGLPTIGQLIELIIELGGTNIHVADMRSVGAISQIDNKDFIVWWDTTGVYQEFIDHLWDLAVDICNTVGKNEK